MLAFFCNYYIIMIDPELEISSGKNISYENFPVGSWLLPRALRPHIITFYNFARAADDIADAANIDPDEKNRQLDQFIEGMTITNLKHTLPLKSLHMAKSLRETNVAKEYCLNLLTAFKQDITKNRYQNWQELIDYCQLSAAPVGRYMIDLHGGFRDGVPYNYKASDALCAALQILNHLQDCREDFELLNRVYLPTDMMKHHNVTLDHLTADKISSALRGCLDEMLDSIDILLSEAQEFPPQLNNLRLGMESQIIINIAIQLSKKLRKSDPISTAVKISKLTYIKCFISGSFKILIRC
jgi:squalene synthase HpnC